MPLTCGHGIFSIHLDNIRSGYFFEVRDISGYARPKEEKLIQETIESTKFFIWFQWSKFKVWHTPSARTCYEGMVCCPLIL